MFSALKSGLMASKNKSNVTHIVTQGLGTNTFANADFRGYGHASGFLIASAFGSLDVATWNGETIYRLVHNHSTSGGSFWRFEVEFLGTHAQSFFTSVIFEDQAELLTASADSHTQVGGNTIWIWDVGSENTTWDGTGDLGVTIA